MGMGKSTALDERSRRLSPIGTADLASGGGVVCDVALDSHCQESSNLVTS